MSATDELRRLLDERGVEWRGGLPTETIVADPIDVLYVQRTDGMMHVYIRSYLTPEQAIAATLGNGTCHSTTPSDAWCFACSECGKSFPRHELSLAHNHGEINFCPNCGKRVS